MAQESLDDRLDAIYEAVLDYRSERTALLVRQELELGSVVNMFL